MHMQSKAPTGGPPCVLPLIAVDLVGVGTRSSSFPRDPHLLNIGAFTCMLHRKELCIPRFAALSLHVLVF